MMAFCRMHCHTFLLDADSRMGAYASFGFDANLLELWAPLTVGATIYIIPEELRLDLVALNNYFEQNGITHVAEGSNTDDTGDYRPGMRAIRELGVLSPLLEAGLSKSDIRALSKELDLPTWDKPSFACLASRFVYGERITDEKLSLVDRAEQLLLDLGFRQFRVRIHGDLARIEILPEDFGRLMEENLRERIYASLKTYGFSYITLDLAGYRTGSMNEVLKR